MNCFRADSKEEARESLATDAGGMRDIIIMIRDSAYAAGTLCCRPAAPFLARTNALRKITAHKSLLPVSE